MQTNFINQPNIPYNSQNQSQPLDQPYIPPNTLPYIPQPNLQQIPQPYIVQPVIYAYGAQPEPKPNLQQPGTIVNLKNKLCCPKFWTWFVFGFQILGGFGSFGYYKEAIVGSVVGCVACFVVALLVTQCHSTLNVKKYNAALAIFSVFFILDCAYYVVSIFWFNKFLDIKHSFNYNYRYIDLPRIVLMVIVVKDVVFGLITVIVLCCYKKVFDVPSLPDNQQLIP